MKNRTTFVIARCLSTVRKANRILVFEAGRVVEDGTFDALVAKGGRSPSARAANGERRQNRERQKPAQLIQLSWQRFFTASSSAVACARS